MENKALRAAMLPRPHRVPSFPLPDEPKPISQRALVRQISRDFRSDLDPKELPRAT